MHIGGRTIYRQLLDTDPRIVTPGGRDRENSTEPSISIMPYMMSPGDEQIVADKLYALLSKPPVRETDSQPAPPATDVSGQWDVLIRYTAGIANHKLHLRQQGSRIDGTHQGDFVARDLSGTIDGDRVQVRSTYAEEHGDALSYSFDGKVSGDDMSGTLDMGEYLSATWTAKRHQYRGGRGA